MGAIENGGELIGDDVCCWNPMLGFANGFVAERLSELAPVGLLSSFGSAMPVGLGSIDCRNGFVDVCCGCMGSAIVGICICCCCCEKSGMPFCGIDGMLLCGLKGCGV